MSNRLIHETSPYLLQHANNPVDWYSWGEEALERSRSEDRPILLSIGYSACHWCHVMERESFEDPETARLMNERFVNVKVDREERPDLDAIYMSAVQAMTGQGGWPLTVFLTPGRVPFFGGTYFPPRDRPGMPSFKRVLLAVSEAYRDRREEIEQGASQLRDALQRSAMVTVEPGEPDAELLEQAAATLLTQFDPLNGGFGAAPKFPQPMALEFLLRYAHGSGNEAAREAVQFSLRKMAAGGIYDQLGGGFHRYAVDAHWQVPHFEKMLYDNALLSHTYLAAYQATGDEMFRGIVEETLDYVRREMTSPEGGFYSTEDADSEGEEGKFYVWTPAEVRAALDAQEAHVACVAFGITEQGNFDGKSVLQRARSPAQVAAEVGLSESQAQTLLEQARKRLFEAREQRARPARDEKVLSGWNGLMLRSFAEAARVLKREDFRAIAERNGAYLLDHLLQEGAVLRSCKDGVAKLRGYLEDFANLVDGLLALYEATFDLRWLRAAVGLADRMLDEFWDDGEGGFFETGRGHETLIFRPKELTDNATPSGNAVAADVLLRLALLTGEVGYRRRAVRLLSLARAGMARYPLAFGRMLCALDFALATPVEIALVGDPSAADTQSLLDATYKHYLPNKVVALKRPGEQEAEELIPLLAERRRLNGHATAFICQHFACQMPVTEPAKLAEQLGW